MKYVASEQGWLPIKFTRDSLVGYLTTQSNVEAALNRGESLEGISAALHADLSGMDLGGQFRYHYHYELVQYQHTR